MKIAQVLLVGILCATSQVLKAQLPENVRSYAVIGVFDDERNATVLAERFNDQSLSAKIKKNTFNDHFYVFVEESKDVEFIRSRVLELREQFKSLSETWLYNGNFDCSHIPSDQLTSSSPMNESSQSSGVDESESMVKNTAFTEQADIPEESLPAAVKKSTKPKMEKPQGKFWVFFNTYNETDLSEIPGHVKMQDVERSKELGKYPTQELVTLNDPNNGTRKVKFESDVFGFRVEERLVDLDDPMNSESVDHLTIIGDSIVIDMPLKRYNKGDYMTMWNVYFYIDAAIMKEESVLELNQLLDLMQDNESVRIKIHGHTNGNSHGVVKHLDLDDKSFFSLNGSHLEDRASSRKLSEFRAYTIQHWLMDQGIAEDRMEIQGWGGKKMSYDKHSANADKNVRVEIEILEE